MHNNNGIQWHISGGLVAFVQEFFCVHFGVCRVNDNWRMKQWTLSRVCWQFTDVCWRLLFDQLTKIGRQSQAMPQRHAESIAQALRTLPILHLLCNIVHSFFWIRMVGY